MAAKVLVVDDSLMVRTLVGRTLTSAGFVVIQAGDGAEGLQKLAATPDVELVVCDVNMPNMSGLEFLEALSTSGKSNVSVLMLTTEASADMKEKARSLGAKGWLVKPFKPEFLLTAAKKLTTSAQ